MAVKRGRFCGWLAGFLVTLCGITVAGPAAFPWLIVDAPQGSWLPLKDVTRMAGADGRLYVYSDKSATMGEITPQHEYRVIAEEKRDPDFDPVSVFGRKFYGSVRLRRPLTAGIMNIVGRGDTVFVLSMETPRNASGGYRLVQTLRDGKMKGGWFFVGASLPAYSGRFPKRQPFDVTEDSEYVMVAPDKSTALVIYDEDKGPLDQYNFEPSGEQPVATGKISRLTGLPLPPGMAQAPDLSKEPKNMRELLEWEHPERRDEILAERYKGIPKPPVPAKTAAMPWKLDWIEDVYCMEDDTVVVVDNKQDRAVRFNRDGKILAKSEDRYKAKVLRLFGSNRKWLVGYDKEQGQGVFLDGDFKEVGSFAMNPPIQGVCAVFPDERTMVVAPVKMGDTAGIRYYKLAELADNPESRD